MKTINHLHSVKLDKDKCVGCTNCIKRCPTQAIRVRNSLARISENRCIDCGECIRACPHDAKQSVNDPFGIIQGFDIRAALIAPSFYTQFGSPANREAVLNSILSIGFDDVYEVAAGADVVTEHTAAFLNNPGPDTLFPVISSACPVVVRIIQMKYPALIGNLLPYNSPMEVIAEIARKELSARHCLSPDKIGVFFISPCPAKRTAVKMPYGISRSNVDGVLAVSEIYPMVLEALIAGNKKGASSDIVKNKYLPKFSGIRWASIGGESISLNTDRFLAVDGIHNVISILEEIENERLKEVDFIEANACIGGCIGGPLNVANRFSAKTRLSRYVEETRLQALAEPEKIFHSEKVRIHKWKKSLESNPALSLDTDISGALEKYEKMTEIAHTLPGLDCGACGSPDCMALAEDIVKGEAKSTDCIFILKEKIQQVAEQMSILSPD
ncbi:MAG: [Fe-Fe] hydrogenase large subunit C-terminal domain-containing protein [Saccharofermentanales bacterium]